MIINLIESFRNILTIIIFIVIANFIINILYKYYCYNLLITVSNNSITTNSNLKRKLGCKPGTNIEEVTYLEFINKDIPKFYAYVMPKAYNVTYGNIGCGIIIFNQFICIYDIIYIPKSFKDYLQILGYVDRSLCIPLNKKHPERKINNKYLETYFSDLIYKYTDQYPPVIEDIFIFDTPYNINGTDIKSAIYYDEKTKSINIIGLINTIESLSYIKTLIEMSILNTKTGDSIICADEESAVLELKKKWINMGMDNKEYNKIICAVSENLIDKPYLGISDIIFFDKNKLSKYSKTTCDILTNKALRKYTASSYINH